MSTRANAQQSGKPKCDRDNGFSLLEVLIALCILACSLLALVAFSTAAWRRTYDASLAGLAQISAVNRAEAAYAMDKKTYHQLWQQSVQQILPHGQGTYTGASDAFVVAICWQQLFRHTRLCYKLNAE